MVQRSKVEMNLVENFDALLFDCDGVIAETERDAHRVTFNQAFQSKGITVEWNEVLYGELLRIGGGKERMTAYFNEVGWPTSISEDKRDDTIKELHKIKTAKFQSVIESGVVPPRPGVLRLMDEAFANNIAVAICSTSNEAAVTTIAKTLLGEERLAKIKIFAGDVVAKKKPSPDVYLLAATTLNVNPSRCWVVEDSEIGLKAAKAAGMKCIVTKSVYTTNEHFENADVIVNNLDSGLDGLISISYLDYKASSIAYKTVKSVDNAELFGATPNYADMFNKITKGEMGKGMKF
eukprot:gene13895-18632_t